MRTLQTRSSGLKQTLLKIQEMSKTLSNGILAVRVEDHGAELSSIIMNGTEYLWQADPAFWGRHSPVLFPIVGRVWDNVYRVDGKEYGKLYVTHDDILKGGVWEFDMGPKPDRKRGLSKEDKPYSLTDGIKEK